MNSKILFFTSLALLSVLVRSVIAQEIAPDFTLTDIDGVKFSLSGYRGKVVLLDFFDTLCSPCREEIPHLKSLHEEFGEDLIIISISVSPSFDTVERLQQFRQEHEIDWIVARDTIGIYGEYDVQYIPTLVVIDQEGYMQHRHVGLTEELVLSEEIYEIIPEFETWASIIFAFLMLTVAVVILKRRSLLKESNSLSLVWNSEKINLSRHFAQTL